MTENRLTYRIEEEGIGVDVPYDIFHRAAQLKHSNLLRVLKRTDLKQSRQQYHQLSNEEGRYALRFNTKRVGGARSDTPFLKAEKVRTIVGALHEIELCAALGDRRDPELSFGLSLFKNYGTCDNRLPMYGKVARPELPHEEVQAVTTETMRRMARNIKIYPEEMRKIPRLVGALYDSRGLSLIAHSSGSSTLDTNGDTYSEDTDTIEVFSHNIESPAMQLVCLSGLVAVARAR